MIDLHVLPPVPTIDGARIRVLTGDDSFPADTRIVLNAFRAEVGQRRFHVGFCLGDGERFSAIGLAVIDRLVIEAPGAPLHVVPIVHEEIAWDMVLRHLRTFSGRVLLFAFSDSDVYDAGIAETFYFKHVRRFDYDGREFDRLTHKQRRDIQTRKAAMLGRPAAPRFYAASGVDQDDAPWIFRLVTPAGKELRTAVWDGRRDYAHELPDNGICWVGGRRIAIVQVDSPVGVSRRSSLLLTHHLAQQFDGVIHWARDTETFQSILRSFIRLDLESVAPPDLPADWSPEIVILAANSTAEGEPT